MAAITLGNYDGYTGEFLTDLSDVYSNRLGKLSLKNRVSRNSELYNQKACLLTAYYEILNKYYDIADSGDTNFFTQQELFDIVQHFNNVANSKIYRIDRANVEVPVALTAGGVHDDKFTAQWNEVKGTIKYYLDVATDANFTTYLVGYKNRDVGEEISCTLSGLTVNVPYYYRVRAHNGAAISNNSNVVTVTIPDTITFYSDKIGYRYVTLGGTGNATIQWDDTTFVSTVLVPGTNQSFQDYAYPATDFKITADSLTYLDVSDSGVTSFTSSTYYNTIETLILRNNSFYSWSGHHEFVNMTTFDISDNANMGAEHPITGAFGTLNLSTLWVSMENLISTDLPLLGRVYYPPEWIAMKSITIDGASGPGTLEIPVEWILLETIQADFMTISNFTPYAAWTKLKHLSLWGSYLTSCDVKVEWVDLEYLDLGYNLITTFTTRPEWTKLKYFAMYGNDFNVAGINVRSQWIELEQVWLGSCNLDTVSIPAGITTLHTIDLSNNNLTSFTAQHEWGTPLLRFSLAGNNIAVSGTLDAILVELNIGATAGAEDGSASVIYLNNVVFPPNGAMGIPGPAGLAAKDKLEARGYTVYVES